MINVRKELEVALMSSKEMIDSVKSELEVIKRGHTCVIVYQSNEENTLYAMTKTDMNQISQGIKNIMPMPSKNNVKVMSYETANNVLSLIPCILNGKGIRYEGKVVAYTEYLKMYLERAEINFEFLSKTLGN